MKFAAIALSVVPGLGHVIYRRIGKGLVLFFFFCAFINTALMVPFYTDGPDARPWILGAGLSAALLWLYGMGDILWSTLWLDSEEVQERKWVIFDLALARYAEQDYGQARDAIQEFLAIDPYDPRAWFYLGLAHRGLGQLGRAKHAFRKCQSLDHDRLWHEKVVEELQNLKPLSRI